MGFFTDFGKNAYSFSDKEIDLLIQMLSFVENDLPFPKRPSQLLSDKDVKLMWAPTMLFAEEDCTFGLWTYMSPSNVYICPEKNRLTAARIEKECVKLNEKESASVGMMKKMPTWLEVSLKNINDKEYDKELIAFIMFLLESDGHALSTMLHEMWHRQQFLASPFRYFISCLVTNLVSYEWACNQSWSIENDVRVKVDNDELKSKFRDIYGNFYPYIFALNKINKPNISDEEKEAMKIEIELAEEDSIVNKLIGLCKR